MAQAEHAAPHFERELASQPAATQTACLADWVARSSSAGQTWAGLTTLLVGRTTELRAKETEAGALESEQANQPQATARGNLPGSLAPPRTADTSLAYPPRSPELSTSARSPNTGTQRRKDLSYQKVSYS